MRLEDHYRLFLQATCKLYETGEATAITNIIFEWATGFNRQQVVRNAGDILDENSLARLQHALCNLQANQPVQYITGEAMFLEMKFLVSPAVLIPRPETEELVLNAIGEIEKKGFTSLLDIGTGSGCIPISLKKKIPALEATAIDISEAALEVARKNALAFQTDIKFLQIDFLDEKQWAQLPMFDFISSNPPYIPQEEKDRLDKHVAAAEPGLALFVPNDDPIIFYKKMAAFAQNHLLPGGTIMMETHENFAQQVQAYFVQQHYYAEIVQDMFEKNRMVKATRFR